MRNAGQIRRIPAVLGLTRTKNFLDVLQAQARRQPDKTAFIYLEHGEDEAERLTFAELHERAHGVASQRGRLRGPAIGCFCFIRQVSTSSRHFVVAAVSEVLHGAKYL